MTSEFMGKLIPSLTVISIPMHDEAGFVKRARSAHESPVDSSASTIHEAFLSQSKQRKCDETFHQIRNAEAECHLIQLKASLN